MANPKVTVNVGADGVGFHKEWDKIEKRIAKTATEVGGKQLGGIFGAFGEVSAAAGPFAAAAAIVTLYAVMTKNLMEFGHSIQEVSETFGISTDAVQKYSFAAEVAGKDVSVFTNAMEKSSEFAEKALSSNPQYSKQFQLSQRLGLTEDDLRNMPPDKLMKAMIKRGKELKISDTEMDEIVGKKMSRVIGQLVEQAEELDKFTLKLDPATIAMLADSFKIFQVALQDVMVLFRKNLANTLLEIRIFGVLFYDYWREVISKLSGLLAGGLIMTGLGGLGGGSWVKGLMDLSNKTHVTTKEFNDQMNWATGAGLIPKPGEPRVPAVGTVKPMTFSTNEFLKIGGLMGIDTAIRLEKLQLEANALLGQIAENTKPQIMTTAPQQSPLPPLASAPAPFSINPNAGKVLNQWSTIR